MSTANHKINGGKLFLALSAGALAIGALSSDQTRAATVLVLQRDFIQTRIGVGT